MSGEAGPGKFPRMAAVATGIMALLLTLSGVLNSLRTSPDAEPAQKADHRVFQYTILLTALYLISWKYVHFILCTEIFLLAMCRVLKMSVKFAIIYSTVFSVAIYYIFANVFHILL